jgi:hypothetical protein
MELPVVFIPDPFLEEGSTSLHEMLRAARTQPHPALHDGAGVAHPAGRIVMAQRHPRPQPQPRPGIAPVVHIQPAQAPLDPDVQVALDAFEDETAWVEGLVDDTGAALSRTFEGNDQLTQITLEYTRRRMEAGGIADAEEERLWWERRRRYVEDMDNTYDIASYAMRQHLARTLDAGLNRGRRGR